MVFLIFVFVACVLFLFSIFKCCKVVGFSMEPSIRDGDVLLGTCFYKLKRGDVICFHNRLGNVGKKRFRLKWRGVTYIKRIIGLPGDKIFFHSGKVHVNGHIINEPYLARGTTTEYLISEDDGKVWTVPPDMLFVLGDSREKSCDSREFGFVPFESVICKIDSVVLPVERFKTL